MTMLEILNKNFEEITFFRNDEGDYLLCIENGIYKLDYTKFTLNTIEFKSLTPQEISTFINLQMKFEQIGDSNEN